MCKRILDKIALCTGWVGVILIHSSTLPLNIKIILGQNVQLPPLDMILLVWTGLFAFLCNAIIRKDRLYIISNAVGFFFNSIVLSIIVFGVNS